MSGSAIGRTTAVALLLLSAGLPAQQAPESPRQSESTKIVVEANAVLIPVVARDSQGRAVGNLTKKDFQVFDKNKPQAISGFSIETRTGVQNSPSGFGATPIGAVSNRSSADVPISAATPQRIIVFLFDDMHLEPGDLSQVQKSAAKMIGGSLVDSDLAAVLSTSGANSGLTRDRAKLQAAIMKLKVDNRYRYREHACPRLTYYEAVRIVDFHDPILFDEAVEEAIACCECRKEQAVMLVQEVAPRVEQLGDLDVRMTLAALREVIETMTALPGQRTLILISPGFLTINAQSASLASDLLDLAARSSITVNTMDARGLYTTNTNASEERTGSAVSERTTAQHRQVALFGNEEIMADLADATGGAYFHNSNDLDGGFRILTAVPEYIYLLEMSLEHVKQDGSYHSVKVKVDRPGLKLEARRGYFAPEKQGKRN